MTTPTPSTQYVALEGIKHGNRFLTSYRPGDEPAKLADGTIGYRILGYGDTHEQAIRLIYPTQAAQDAALRGYISETTRRRGIQAQQAAFDVAVWGASTLSRVALVEAAKHGAALGSDCAE